MKIIIREIGQILSRKNDRKRSAMIVKFTDDLSWEDFEEEISEMAHLTKRKSGLPYDVLIDYDGKNRARQNNSPRVMIRLDDTPLNFVPVSIDDKEPAILFECEVPEFEVIADWIKENFDTLMKHWNNEIDDYEALVALSLRN